MKRTEWSEPPKSVEEAAERIVWWWQHFGVRRTVERDEEVSA